MGSRLALVALMLLAWAPAHAGERTSRIPQKLDVSVAMMIEGGWASMSRFEGGVSAFADEIRRINPEIQTVGQPGGNLLLAATPRVRIYLPRRTFVETGLGYLRNRGALDVDIGGISGRFSYTNTSIELPVLLGVHWAEIGGALLHAALGPSVLLRNRSDWTYDRGEVSDFGSGRGGGIEFLVGGDVFVSERIGITVNLRYRVAKSSELSMRGEPFPPIPELTELDYSGLSLAIGARWYSFD